MKILFKLVSRSRPERFFKTLDNLHSMIDDKDNFHIVCTLDEDDQTMNNQGVRDSISQYAHTTPMWGRSYSKIHAFNRDMLEISGWDIVVAVSDDFQFTVYGFDRLIREGFQANAPDFDALLHYPDQDARHIIPVLYIAGRKYFNRDLFIYNPIYESLFCDNESKDIAEIRGKYFYMGIQIVNHLNPAYGHLPRDSQFDRQQALWGKDERTYLIRKANNFGFN
jgi:hypothetical protein